MIARLELKNFTAFSDLAIDFSPRVNVIIGENGTGKTHLLKAAYAICSCSSLFNEKDKVGKNKIREALTAKLLRLFMPLDNKLGRMYHRGSSEGAKLEVRFASDTKVAVSFGAKSQSVVLEECENYEHYHDKPLFIPTKEVLSFIKGISAPDSDQATVQNIFDDTYLDLCSSLLVTPSPDKEKKLDFDPRFGTVFPKIVKAIGGRYEFTEGKFCFRQGIYEESTTSDKNKNPYSEKYSYSDKVKTKFVPVKNSELSNNMTAEGFRKIGILQQLLATETLNPGISGPLFWDEPESNMNPKLMRLLVEILDLFLYKE